jgi:hypothetical protein
VLFEMFQRRVLYARIKGKKRHLKS